MAKKDLQQLQTIKERMIAAGIPEDEVNALVDPLKNELQRRVCGLVWEHTTTSIPDMEGKIPALTPVTGKNIVNDINGDNHVLIEGENLLALMAMQYTHIDENDKGMIDVIYIDPPYNTGSVSFAYNDKFEKSEWLSMMDIRLKLARNLLKDDGVIFISIDENYFAECKMLCDDIYSPDKFIGIIVWESSTQPVNSGRAIYSLQNKTEFVLAYGKTDGRNHCFAVETRTIDKAYPEQVNGRCCRFEIIEKSDAGTYSRPTMKFRILGQLPRDGKRWQIGEETARKLETEGKVIVDNGVVKRVIFPEDETSKLSTIPFWSFLCADKYGTAQSGKAMLNSICKRDTGFDTVKSVSMIKELLFHAVGDKKDAIVLDFFAGSGTTGHAVLELNNEDGGHRQFILCTNNELGKEAQKTAKKNGYPVGSVEYEDLGVCHAVTYPRMQNIFPDYPGNNLYYYRIDQNVAESAIDDVTIANMASRAVFYVAMKENVYNAERHDGYYLLYNDETDITVITDPDMDMFDVEDEIVPTAFSRQYKKVYCSVYEPCMRNGIEYIPYPKEVLDVLKAAKKYIRREVV